MNDALKNIIRDIKSNPKYFILIHNYFKSIGTLKPITYYDIGNDDLINSLMIWRNQNIEAYLNHEPATHEGTRKWLTKFVLDNYQDGPRKGDKIVGSKLQYLPNGHIMDNDYNVRQISSNIDKSGRSWKAVVSAPNTTSEKMMKYMSGIPQDKFHLMAKA